MLTWVSPILHVPCMQRRILDKAGSQPVENFGKLVLRLQLLYFVGGELSASSTGSAQVLL